MCIGREEREKTRAERRMLKKREGFERAGGQRDKDGRDVQKAEVIQMEIYGEVPDV